MEQDSNINDIEKFLRNLKLLDEYYSLGLKDAPLSNEIRKIEQSIIHYAQEFQQTDNKETAVKIVIEELPNIEKIITKYNYEKSALIQIMLKIQEKYHWLPKLALKYISHKLDIPISLINHIASFYKAFSLEPQGKHKVRVCLGTACHVRGANQLLDKVINSLNIKVGETDANRDFTLETVNCLGCCALGPIMQIDKDYISNPSSKELTKIFDNFRENGK